MPLKAGTWTTKNEANFADSMAAAIEFAFGEEWAAVYPDHTMDDLSEGLHDVWRAWFAAIAQGVVKYLADHADDSFRVHSVEATQDDGEITSTGTLTSEQIGPLVWGGDSETTVQVTQDSETVGSSNRVETVQGEGSVEILTEGVLHT